MCKKIILCKSRNFSFDSGRDIIFRILTSETCEFRRLCLMHDLLFILKKIALLAEVLIWQRRRLISFNFNK